MRFSTSWKPTIARLAARRNDAHTAEQFQQKAVRRRTSVDKYLWDNDARPYRDYNWCERQKAVFSAAAVTPLYVGMSSLEQATDTAAALRSHLIAPCGLLSTVKESGEQWDRPNGWVPIQGSVWISKIILLLAYYLTDFTRKVFIYRK
ncbi:hypothetical protein LU604_24000 [Erwinia tracheiphila]|uniref:trehalase family glycosidase n=1 Tax=Erwinia tracheiphila TaxID=65700 RepID=UPI001F2FBAB8|nr:trehalase family glycosidase [Erwinia tracheiphila]UIA83339.1 hypothetical protein LU604_24000 [Erwinia tracheiphila]UIA91910.1 hypothetical protein LU632_23380 [Erwinia tracheiphila]